MKGPGSRQLLRVCVCTSYEGAQEPRAPRHAAALADMDGVEVIFVDCAPMRSGQNVVKVLQEKSNLEWRTHFFPTRTVAPFRLSISKIRQCIDRLWFRMTGYVSAGAISLRAYGLKRVLRDTAADAYLAHNIETLLPAASVAKARGALLMFDSMEFHSDMGDSQTAVERKMVRAAEKQHLCQCALVLTSSARLADALAKEYGIPRPLALDNAPAIERDLPPKHGNSFQLYWRNSVVGLGQRGLDDALVALTKVPDDVMLHLQGRTPVDGGAELRARIAELDLTRRVIFHEPYVPHNAVKEASQHTVGLCLERKGCRNHDLTISNKIFDYHMAGLAVIASDLPSLRDTLERSRGGLLFEPGSADDLAKKICLLYVDRALLEQCARHAREFALREGNQEHEMQKFVSAFSEIVEHKCDHSVFPDA